MDTSLFFNNETETNKGWGHINCVVGGDFDHRDFGEVAFACFGKGEGRSQADSLHEQHEAGSDG